MQPNSTLAMMFSRWGDGLTITEEWLDRVIDGGYLPHSIRKGIQYQFRQRARETAFLSFAQAFARKMAFIEELRRSEIAIHTDAVNRQQYDVPTGLMAAALGPRMKYSCCLFETGRETLAEAEDAMLASYVDKLGFQDGMSLLDLGCGWGAAVLYFAERFPNSPIVGFSNSRTQCKHIVERAAAGNFANVQAVTGDAATADLGTSLYDRVLSCEMFEHLKNYDGMMAKTARALRPGGRFLLHVFCHRDTPYHFASGWMATHFFTGGTMPSADLLLYFQCAELRVVDQWWLHGRHYNTTAESWLANFVANRREVWPCLVAMYGEDKAAVWFNRWQVYYLACAEMFVSGGGDTYGVTHYLFEKSQ
jgi:cyclopropane fatty-acyl-phospholipid synthase-like methyltransferase